MMLIRILLKILSVPLLIIFKVMELLTKTATNISCYVLGPFMLFLIGCSIYTIIMNLWTQLAILVVMLISCVIVLFCASWIIVTLENTNMKLSTFLRN